MDPLPYTFARAHAQVFAAEGREIGVANRNYRD